MSNKREKLDPDYSDPEIVRLFMVWKIMQQVPRWAFRAWFVYVAWRLAPSQGVEVAFSVVLAAWALSAKTCNEPT